MIAKNQEAKILSKKEIYNKTKRNNTYEKNTNRTKIKNLV